MARPQQEGDEVFALEWFWANLPGPLDSYVEKGETPDFLFQPSRIGLEVRELVRSAEQAGTGREREAYEAAIAEAAAKLFQGRHPDVFLEVHLIWQPNLTRGAKPGIMAAALVELVEAHVPPVRHGFIDLDWRTWFRVRPLRDELLHLSIVQLDPGPSFWNAGAGSAPELYPEEMQQYISQKEPKVEAIRLKADQAWLLVYAPGDLATNHVIVRPETEAAIFTSSFDRVFLMSWWAWGHLVELRVERPR
jgi:hypothetical protein